MKNCRLFITAVFTALFLFSAVPFTVQAADAGDFSYDVADGKAVITKYNCSEEVENRWVSIPETLGGYPVVYIDSHSFENCRSISSVRLPSGVSEIGDFAFANCRNLTYVYLPSGVKQIGAFAFANCRFLSGVNLQDTNIEIIGARAFESCYTLSSLTLPGSVRNIGFGAFRFSGIKEAVLPSGIENISDSCFEGCSSMKSATIPDTVQAIGICAFAGCSTLETINAFPMTAPALDATSFLYVPETAVLNIRNGAQGYDAEPWLQWKQFEAAHIWKYVDSIYQGWRYLYL